jgi:hypothetical protein
MTRALGGAEPDHDDGLHWPLSAADMSMMGGMQRAPVSGAPNHPA